MAQKSSNARKDQEWNGDVHDLASMKLSKEEWAKRSVSRQSHNIAIAKAEMMDRNRQQGVPQSFSPGVTSRLRATGNKSIEEALADSSAALALAHKIKNEDSALTHARQMASSKLNVGSASSLREQTDVNISSQLLRDSIGKQPGDGSMENFLDPTKKMNDMTLVQKNSEASMNLYPLSPQGWDNLNNTIQLVVKTCEALWQQLEEERHTRERLHLQLQEQRSIITTLTSELLQIQEHQELILRELHLSRSPPAQQLWSYPGPRSSARGDSRHPHNIDDLLRERTMVPTSMADRLASREFAFSDSSIERKKHRSGEINMDEYSVDDIDMHPSPRMLMRMQNKSKSALQINREPESLNFMPEASLINLLQNYHLNE